MGGNVTGVLHLDNTETKAEKVPLRKTGRINFVTTIRKFLNDFNEKFKEMYNEELWNNDQIEMGTIFNGSTSYVMDLKYDTESVENAKEFVGDIDVITDRKNKQKLYNFLLQYENKNISDNVIYKGCNKPEFRRTLTQINTVFEISFTLLDNTSIKLNVQVDFEFLEFKNNEPIEWSRFGHSSNFKDAKENIKAVHHKYLLKSLIGNKYINKDILICTNDSTKDHIDLIDKPARMKIFDVDLGICDKLEKQDFTYDNKEVYKELPRYKYKKEQDLEKVFELTFDKIPTEEERKQFWSFVGLCELIKKYCSKKEIDLLHDRYVNFLWSSSPERTQEIERDNAQLDNEVKYNGYKYFTDMFKLENRHEQMAKDYYLNYGLMGKNYLSESCKTFSEFIALKNYVQEYY